MLRIKPLNNERRHVRDEFKEITPGFCPLGQINKKGESIGLRDSCGELDQGSGFPTPSGSLNDDSGTFHLLDNGNLFRQITLATA